MASSRDTSRLHVCLHGYNERSRNRTVWRICVHDSRQGGILWRIRYTFTGVEGNEGDEAIPIILLCGQRYVQLCALGLVRNAVGGLSIGCLQTHDDVTIGSSKWGISEVF